MVSTLVHPADGLGRDPGLLVVAPSTLGHTADRTGHPDLVGTFSHPGADGLSERNTGLS